MVGATSDYDWRVSTHDVVDDVVDDRLLMLG